MKETTVRTPVTRDGRRQFTVWQKRLILREHVEQGVSITYLARKYQVHPVTIYQWKRVVDLCGKMKDPHGDMDELLEELDRLRKENHRLKLAVSELVVEKSCQKDVISEFKKREDDEKFKRLRKQQSLKVIRSSGPAGSSASLVKASTRQCDEKTS